MSIQDKTSMVSKRRAFTIDVDKHKMVFEVDIILDHTMLTKRIYRCYIVEFSGKKKLAVHDIPVGSRYKNHQIGCF